MSSSSYIRDEAAILAAIITQHATFPDKIAAAKAARRARRAPRDEAAILVALDALDDALLAVSVAARNAAAADDGAGDTYDAHLDVEYAIRRVFDLTN